jgi:hypothetical protein
LHAVDRGEIRDLETGFLHLAHAGCNAGFLLSFQDGLDAPLTTETLQRDKIALH